MKSLSLFGFLFSELWNEEFGLGDCLEVPWISKCLCPHFRISKCNDGTEWFPWGGNNQKWCWIGRSGGGLAAAAAASLQSCPTLCDPIDGSPLGSPVPGILQARTLEWVAISFSSAGKWKVKVKLLSRVQLLATPWTAAYQAPLSMGFSRQEYWSGVPLPSPEGVLEVSKWWAVKAK